MTAHYRVLSSSVHYGWLLLPCATSPSILCAIYFFLEQTNFNLTFLTTDIWHVTKIHLEFSHFLNIYSHLQLHFSAYLRNLVYVNKYSENGKISNVFQSCIKCSVVKKFHVASADIWFCYFVFNACFLRNSISMSVGLHSQGDESKTLKIF